jgi:hypothetical protein
MMKNAAIRYDFLTNTLYVTKSYLDKAGVFGSPEYKEIKKYRDDNPGMEIKVAKRTAPKSDNRPVTVKYTDMEHFIKQFPKEQQKSLMERYNKVKALSKTHRSPYKFVLDWFLDYFPLYNSDAAFDETGNLTILKTKFDIEENDLQSEMDATLEAVKEAVADADEKIA